MWCVGADNTHVQSQAFQLGSHVEHSPFYLATDREYGAQKALILGVEQNRLAALARVFSTLRTRLSP